MDAVAGAGKAVTLAIAEEFVTPILVPDVGHGTIGVDDPVGMVPWACHVVVVEARASSTSVSLQPVLAHSFHTFNPVSQPVGQGRAAW